MHTSRTLGMLLVAVCLLGLSCSESEREVLDPFFTAVQRGDERAIKVVSLVPFPGKVRSWEIVEVGPQSSEPFALPALQGEISELSEERRTKKEENDAFLEAHKSAFDQYRAKREKDPDYEFTGALADFQRQWEERRSAQEKLDRDEIDLMKQIDRLRVAAGMSVNYSVDENFEGEVLGKDVTLKVNDGSAEKTYAFTLRKFNLANAKRNISPIGRWVITDIKEAGA